MLRNLWLGLMCAAATYGTAQAAAGQEKIGDGLKALLSAKKGPQDVLVYMKAQASLAGVESLESKEARGRFVFKALTETAKASQGALLEDLAAKKLAVQSFYVANAVAIEGASPELIAALAKRPEVDRVLANPTVHVFDAPSVGQMTNESVLGVGENITRVKADRVWNELRNKGEGIVVAGNDTGIEWTHPGLKAHYRGWNGATADHNYNWHDSIHKPLVQGLKNDCGYDTQAPCDDNSHGTHTIGTVVGDDGAGNQVGMAPGAKFIGCRNMDAGNGKPSTYLECFQYFLAPWPYGGDPARDGDASKAPHVINNSWGCPSSEGCSGTEFVEALNNLKAAGIMVVAAAGNEGSGCSTIADAPAHHTDEVLVVGAIDHRSGNIASFSSRGPSAHDGKVSPDVSAPGVSVRSSIPGGGFSGSMWSGTSMASPHVAGAVALLWAVKPALVGKIDETVDLLRRTAEAKTSTQTCGTTAGSSVPNNTFGNGIIDVYKAATTN